MMAGSEFMTCTKVKTENKMTDEDKSFWLSWCIEEYAYEKNKPAVEISKLFDKSGVLSYLDENAEVLHTQGRNFILGEIDEYLKTK